MCSSLLDLPDELLLEVLSKVESLHTYNALAQTAKPLRRLLREIVIVFSDRDEDKTESTLLRFNLNRITLEQMSYFVQRYTFFVFQMSSGPGISGISDTIRLMKILLKQLQMEKKYHSITITRARGTPQNINGNPLIRFLLPKMNSPYTEWFFPQVRTINGCDDLRLLDNTYCHFDVLQRLTIGSFSFQLFHLRAPELKTLNLSEQLKKHALNESVSASKISYSKFLSEMRGAMNLEELEVVSRVEPLTLNSFQNLRVLRIYGDHVTSKFNRLSFFGQLRELVITKCYRLEDIEDLEGDIYNTNLEILDLSNNKRFRQVIKGKFTQLRLLNLSNTAISVTPMIQGPKLTVNITDCHNLN